MATSAKQSCLTTTALIQSCHNRLRQGGRSEQTCMPDMHAGAWAQQCSREPDPQQCCMICWQDGGVHIPKQCSLDSCCITPARRRSRGGHQETAKRISGAMLCYERTSDSSRPPQCLQISPNCKRRARWYLHAYYRCMHMRSGRAGAHS